MDRVKRQARMSGWLYLALAVVGPFALVYVPSVIVDAANPAATVANLVARGDLYRLGMVGEISIVLVELALVAVLYSLLGGVDRTLARIMVYTRLAMAVVQAANVVVGLVPVFVAEETGATDIVVAFLTAHEYGVYVWQLLFAMHLVFLGVLVARSRMFPKWLGYVLAAASVGYALDSLGRIMVPRFVFVGTLATPFLVISAIGEMVFTFWLIIKGAADPTPEGQNV